MAFWSNGDTITADKLNTTAAMFVFHVTSNTNTQTFSTPDKTYADVLAALNNGMIPVVYITDSYTDSIHIGIMSVYSPNTNKMVFGNTDVDFQYSSSTGFGIFFPDNDGIIDVN